MHYAVIYNLLTQHWKFSEELRTDLFTSRRAACGTQRLHRIEILIVNKWNCLFQKWREGRSGNCVHPSCPAALFAAEQAYAERRKSIKQFCISILPNEEHTIQLCYLDGTWQRWKIRWADTKYGYRHPSEERHSSLQVVFLFHAHTPSPVKINTTWKAFPWSFFFGGRGVVGFGD